MLAIENVEFVSAVAYSVTVVAALWFMCVTCISFRARTGADLLPSRNEAKIVISQVIGASFLDLPGTGK